MFTLYLLTYLNSQNILRIYIKACKYQSLFTIKRLDFNNTQKYSVIDFQDNNNYYILGNMILTFVSPSYEDVLQLQMTKFLFI